MIFHFCTNIFKIKCTFTVIKNLGGKCLCLMKMSQCKTILIILHTKISKSFNFGVKCEKKIKLL